MKQGDTRELGFEYFFIGLEFWIDAKFKYLANPEGPAWEVVELDIYHDGHQLDTDDFAQLYTRTPGVLMNNKPVYNSVYNDMCDNALRELDNIL